jgi:uncharacterized membrane protein YkoI
MKAAGLRKFSLIFGALTGLACGVFSAPPATADGNDWPGIFLPQGVDSHRRGQADEMRAQENSGPSVSLKDVRRIVRRQFGGQILDTQLFQTGGGWVYRVRVLMDDGRVVDVGVDGQTGQIIGVQG